MYRSMILLYFRSSSIPSYVNYQQQDKRYRDKRYNPAPAPSDANVKPLFSLLLLKFVLLQSGTFNFSLKRS